MPKVQVSAAKRAKEFPNSGLDSKNGKLWCSFCSQEDFTKKSVLELHLRSSKHNKNKELLNRALLNQPKINEVTENEQRWQSMTEAFVSAGVPLNTFSNPAIREWMKHNVKSGITLPSVTSLRRTLKQSGTLDKEDTIAFLRDKDIVIMADESIDIKNRKIFNILAKPLEPNCNFRLISSKIILHCNALEVAQLIDSALSEHFVKKSNVVCFISDNAPYMMLAGQKLMVLCDRMMHSTCWAHILHLVSEELRDNLKNADKFISSMKACLVKSPNRRNRLLQTLKEYECQVRLPPTPVLTRWTTWITAADYYWQNFEAVADFIKCSPEDSAAIRKLKSMLENDLLVEELERISKVSQGLTSSIESLENDQSPASSVWLNLKATESLLNFCGMPSDKLQLYIQQKHPSVAFWREVQFLDARKAGEFLKDNYSIPGSLLRFSNQEVPLQELAKYKILSDDEGIYTSTKTPFQFWQSYSKDMPNLSALALSALSVPGSSASVERSFSKLKHIFTSLRTSMTDDNLELHLKLSFNKCPDLSKYDTDVEYDSD